jgi:hypothetical protein
MTTLTSPHDLLAAVPFLVGYHPTNSLVVISLKDESLGMAMRVDYPEDVDLDQIDTLAEHLTKENANGALVVAYVPDGVFDSEYLLEPLREAIAMRGIKLRECLEVRHNRWRSSICIDHDCCPPDGNPMPDLEASRIAAEQVANGKPLPFTDLEGMAASIAPESSDPELAKLVKAIKEIDYESDNQKLLQRVGALAVNDLAGTFARDGICEDKKLIALVIARLQDLQVRDYAMGITDAENIETLWSMWRWVLRIAPKGYVAPIASLFSAVSYEKGDGALAQRSLDRAFDDDPKYPLAKLLRRVYAAGWPPESFARMRADLHPKVCASLFGK